MERVIRQTILRRNQLAVKTRKTDLKDLRKQWREYNRHQAMNKNTMDKFIREEQNSRREDWICGPLAPNRDAGGMKGRYGGVPNMIQRGGKIPPRYRQGPSSHGPDHRGTEDRRRFPDGEWRGQGIQGNVVVGDRVAVIKGRPGVKGMIGEINRILRAEQQVIIKDVNRVDIMAPANMADMRDRITPAELAINMSDIRLVMAMQDDERGIHRDYIVNEVRGGPPYQQRELGSNLPRHTRYVDGTGFDIPWPSEQIARTYPTDDDTTRIDVDHRTYVPSLTFQPLEDGVIDELRGKYSRTRKTHDDMEWVKRKVLEDARQSWLEQRQYTMVRRPKSTVVPKTLSEKESIELRNYAKEIKQKKVQEV